MQSTKEDDENFYPNKKVKLDKNNTENIQNDKSD